MNLEEVRRAWRRHQGAVDLKEVTGVEESLGFLSSGCRGAEKRRRRLEEM